MMQFIKEKGIVENAQKMIACALGKNPTDKITLLEKQTWLSKLPSALRVSISLLVTVKHESFLLWIFISHKLRFFG